MEVMKSQEKMLNPNHKLWSLGLYDALWTYHTTYKTILEMSPYMHIYVKSCQLPNHLEYKAYYVVKAL